MKIENKKHLKVPENYFSELTSDVMTNIRKLESVKTVTLEPISRRRSLKSRQAIISFIGGTAAAMIILLFMLPTEYSPFQSKEKNSTNQELLISQGEYYLFLEDMQGDAAFEEEYWMSLTENN